MRVFFTWVAFILLFSMLVKSSNQETTTVQDLKFSEFVSAVQQDEIKDVTFKNGGQISGTFVKPTGKITSFNSVGDTSNIEIFKILMIHHIIPNYDFQEKSPWVGILISLLPMILTFLMIGYFMSKATNQASKSGSFGKSNSKLVKFEGKVGFADVAGHEDVKEDLKEIIDYLQDPTKYTKMGAKVPKGVLMDGPPGTGKTLLAKATAGEAGVPFFSTSGSEFVEMYVGVGASRVRDMFATGRKNAPCIIFIDEIDAIGRKRGGGGYGGHDEREQTLNQILVEMDGFNNNNGVIIMAATNRADVLDAALVRPGRFDRKVSISNPDIKSRQAILEVHSKGKPIDSSVDLNTVARGTPGFSGADLENLVNEATLLAVRDKLSVVNTKHFESAKDKIMMGPERRTLIMSDKEKLNTSVHEIGHVLVNKLLGGLDPIHKVTIIPRGQALGLTHTIPEDDRVSMSKERAEKMIAFLMGGRAAEEIVFGELTAGASNDISRATELARRMITEWGMSSLGTVELKHTESTPLSQDILAEIDRKIKEEVGNARDVAMKLLTDNRDKLDKLSAVLLEKETLTGAEVDSIIA